MAMKLKLPTLLAAVIAAGATTTVAASPSNNLRTAAESDSDQQERTLQASAGCIAGGGDFISCCPGPAADPNDGICTMLWCVDLEDVTVRDTCNCAEITLACSQVAVFSTAVDGLTEMCAAATSCCSGGTATNPDWDNCMATKADNEEYKTPNFNNLIPGGIPDLSGVPANTAAQPEAVPIPSGPSCPATLDKMEELDDITTLYYAIVPASSWDADDGLLCARMEVDGERWVGFGISNDGMMVGSDAIIGTDGSVMKYNLEQGSLFREANAMEESEQTLMDTSLTVEGGVTKMAFTKKLMDGDDIPILEVGDNIFLWAYGNDDSVTYHASRGKITKNFMDDDDMTTLPNPVQPDPAATTGPTETTTTVTATTAGPAVTTTAGPAATTTMVKATQAPPAITGPPASMACFIGQKPFMECCPAIDPADGICTLLWCVDTEDLEVRDNCECGQVVTSCGQLKMFEAQVDGLAEMCSAATTCCSAGETANDEFNTCMEAAKGDFTIPDFSNMIAGGLPNFEEIEPVEVTTAATAAAPSGTTVAATTVAPEATTAPTEPTGTSGGVGVCAATGVAATSLIAAMVLA